MPTTSNIVNSATSTSAAKESATPEAKSGLASDFRAGLVRGVWISALLSVLLLYLASMSGVVQVTLARYPDFVELWYWTYNNLRTSVVPFVLVLAWFGFSLVKLRSTLNLPAPTYELVYRLDKRIDLLVGLFFGIGVIWTAIGMRSALIGALGGLDAESAARLGAFGVLQAMVDEGILLALSTTIVGGIGGYLMRLVKMGYLGTPLDSFYAQLNTRSENEVLLRLQAIEQAIRDQPVDSC